MRKLLALAVLLAVLVCMTATGCAESPDLYDIGLEVVGVMDEMVQSRDYLNLFLQNENAVKLIDTVFNTGDYDKPVSVYRLVQTDPEKWLMAQLQDEERAVLESLSPALQEQVRIRMKGISLLTNQINARRGVETLSVSAVLQALLDKPELEIEEPEYYLFVFNKGVPVLVTYSWHYVGAMFCVLESTETESAETLQECVKPFGLEVIPADIP
jgi:hypothetical protein